MTAAVLFSRAQVGLSAPLVHVEVLITGGLPQFNIVGLPETAVKESRDRVRGAILSSGFEFPRKRITVNLAPADLPKDGGRFDLAIALGILRAAEQLAGNHLERYEFLGELALTGTLRPIRGALTAAIGVVEAKRALLVSEDDTHAASLVPGAEVYGAPSLRAAWNHLSDVERLPACASGRPATAPSTHFDLDLSQVHGQYAAKRALEVAAAGRHNLLMTGPPGTGKTMLANRLPTLLPPLTDQEALETAALYSISQSPRAAEDWYRAPFRSPHHSASAVALVGGSSRPRPGEVSLAHNGVLFLDELGEFGRSVLEGLREPIEAGRVTVSRAALQAEFPARFQFVATMNPCPCGYLNDGTPRCHCSDDAIRRYQLRISGPLLDRIDILLAVPRSKLRGTGPPPESSETVRDRVIRAHEIEIARSGKPNSALSTTEIGRHCRLDQESSSLLTRAVEELALSERAVQRVLRLARTIADLNEDEHLTEPAIAEAIGYRRAEWRLA